jgi:hypothetical protein
MIDFGAVATLPGGIPPVLARILRHVADGEVAPMMRLLRAEELVRTYLILVTMRRCGLGFCV